MTEHLRRINTCDQEEGGGVRQHCTHADAAAERAVVKTFAILGVDIRQPEQVKRFQKALWFSEKIMKYADHGPIVFFCAGIGLTVIAIVAGVKLKIFGG